MSAMAAMGAKQAKKAQVPRVAAEATRLWTSIAGQHHNQLELKKEAVTTKTSRRDGIETSEWTLDDARRVPKGGSSSLPRAN